MGIVRKWTHESPVQVIPPNQSDALISNSSPGDLKTETYACVRLYISGSMKPDRTLRANFHGVMQLKMKTAYIAIVKLFEETRSPKILMHRVHTPSFLYKGLFLPTMLSNHESRHLRAGDALHDFSRMKRDE